MKNKNLVTKEDLILFDEMDDTTLAEWWNLLNDFKWPEMLSNEQIGYVYKGRRSQLMVEIDKRVGGELISWICNQNRMTKAQHNDFWEGTYKGDSQAYKRYLEWIKRNS